MRLSWLSWALCSVDIALVRCRGGTLVSTMTSGHRNMTTGSLRLLASPWPLWWDLALVPWWISSTFTLESIQMFLLSLYRRRCRLEDMARGFISVRRWPWQPLSPFLCRWMENPVDWLHPSYASPSGTRPTCCRRPREESLYHNYMSQYLSVCLSVCNLKSDCFFSLWM